MFVPHARRVVAMVTDLFPFGDVAIIKFPRYAMCAQLRHVLAAFRPVRSDNSVATGCMPSPHPATISLFNLGPEPFFERRILRSVSHTRIIRQWETGPSLEV